MSDNFEVKNERKGAKACGRNRYIIVDEASGANAVVDPYDPAKLEAAAKEHNLKLGEYLLTTHHHEDHSGGNKEFIAKYPGVKVYAGSDKAPGANHIVRLFLANMNRYECLQLISNLSFGM